MTTAAAITLDDVERARREVEREIDGARRSFAALNLAVSERREFDRTMASVRHRLVALDATFRAWRATSD